MTVPNTPSTPPANAETLLTHANHARVAHAVFGAVESIVHIITNPAVVALLPPRYRGYAAAIAAVDQAIEAVAKP